ncbi:MAG: AAA family ATPase [Lachnospiraceae bacterium]
MVKVITGIRRCGKSIIMRQIIDEIRVNGIGENWLLI